MIADSSFNLSNLIDSTEWIISWIYATIFEMMFFSDIMSFFAPLAMFTLYRIGFCSIAKVAPVQCEQELMFRCSAENVPKRSQCEQKSYPSYILQRSLLIWKDYLPKRGSIAISALIEVFRLDLDLILLYFENDILANSMSRCESTIRYKSQSKNREGERV